MDRRWRSFPATLLGLSNYQYTLRHLVPLVVTVHVLVRLLVFSFLVIGVLGRLLSWLQKLADVVVLH